MARTAEEISRVQEFYGSFFTFLLSFGALLAHLKQLKLAGAHEVSVSGWVVVGCIVLSVAFTLRSMHATQKHLKMEVKVVGPQNRSYYLFHLALGGLALVRMILEMVALGYLLVELESPFPDVVEGIPTVIAAFILVVRGLEFLTPVPAGVP